MSLTDDARQMRAAYRAAIPAIGNSDPNPAVGAVVVSTQGEIIGSGATQRAGFPHAERFALQQLPGIDLGQAALYVTLEPCCHHGRTPPCVDIILERKIRRVIIAERDFAAEVMGRSVSLLREQGVDVSLVGTQAFEDEAWFTTGPFFFARKNTRPRITLKWAETHDGALAPAAGPSGAISGATAAYVTAALRSFHKYTLATPGAVAADRPRLNVRFPQGQPDLSASGLSEFFRGLLQAQPGIAARKESEGTQVKNPHRGFLAGPMNPVERAEFHQRQTGIDGNFTAFPFLTVAWHGDFHGEMAKVLKTILERGYNNMLIEAGPVFSRLLLEHGFADAVAVYRSKTKTSTGLWGAAGKGNRFKDFQVDFHLCENADLSEDEFFFYRRKP